MAVRTAPRHPTSVKTVRASEQQWAAWAAEAASEGLTLNAWVGRSCDEAAACASALREETRCAADERELLRRLAFPQESEVTTMEKAAAASLL